MCVAIYKPKKSTIKYEDLLACHETNPDGMGFAVVIDNKLLTHRQMDNFPSFFKLLDDYQNEQIVIHFRISTHGKINRANCHPHLINNGMDNKSIAFAHNGILSKYTPNAKSKVSDTVIFRKTMLEPLVQKYPDAIFKDQHLIKLLGEAIGRGNKLVLLDCKGNHSIINEDEGETIKGVWYSNTHWQFSDFTHYGNWGNSGPYRGKYFKRPNSNSGYYRKPTTTIYSDDEIESICETCNEPFEADQFTLDDTCDECTADIILEQASGQLD